VKKPKNQKNNRKKLHVILVIIIPIIIVSYIGFTFSLRPRINTFANEIKNLPIDNNQLYISTSATDAYRGYDNNYVLDSNSGKYFSIKESTISSANEDIVSTNVLGKYNGYTYIYVSSEGIAKIKNGKSSMVVSRANIDNISMKSNRLIYEDCDWFSMCRETHLVNLDNEVDKILMQSNGDNNRYSSNITLYKSGFISTIRNSVIAIYDKNGNSIATIPDKSIGLWSVDDNNLYFMNIYTKEPTIVTRYNYKKKIESQITFSDYYSYIYNIKDNVTIDGQRLVDVTNHNTNTNTNTDLDTLMLENNDNLFFKSKDELKIFKVNKKTGVKTRIFDCSMNSEKIMGVVWI